MAATIQSVVIESKEDRTELARLLREFAFAMRSWGHIGCDKDGSFTRAKTAWQAATGEVGVSSERLANLCNEHSALYSARALEC